MMMSSRVSPSRNCVVIMLFLATVLSFGRAAFILHDKYRSVSECETDSTVSGICYHCGELTPSAFQTTYNMCCANTENLRKLCTDLYTEEPKRGRRTFPWYRR